MTHAVLEAAEAAEVWGFPESDPEAVTSLDDWPIPYTLTPEGEAAAYAEAGLEPEAGL